MADDIKISIGANTDNFQTGIDKAFKTVSEFGNKNKELASLTDVAFRQLSKIAASTAGSVQASFNELSVKSDASMKAMEVSLNKASAAFNVAFNKIVADANTSSNDVERAFRKLGELNATLDASTLKNEFKTLGIESAASIEAAKLKIQNAFEEIKLSGTKSPQDVTRAHEAMVAKITELDNLLVTSAEKVAAARKLSLQEMKATEQALYATQGMQGEFAASKLIGQQQAGSSFANELKAQMESNAQFAKLAAEKVNIAHDEALAEIKVYEQAAQMNQKFDYDKIRSAKAVADAKIKALHDTMLVEKAAYASQTMSSADAAAKLIGQPLAGSGFSNTLKTQMEEAARLNELMVREMASYAAAAMQGEAAAAKLTGQLQAGSGFAAQLKAQMEGVAQETELSAKRFKELAAAEEYALRNKGANTDRLQGSFDVLGLKSSLNIEAERAKVIAAFDKIKVSGVASANEIKQAHVAMKRKLDEIEGVKPPADKHAHSINLLSLASIAAIAKVQILYSLINQTMSLIGSLPSTAIDAIETFQSSMIKNAAVITSMGGGVADIGKAYQENKKYAEAVQNVLVKMDAHTIASYKQLQLMNDAFVNQGVFIDINNKKQLQGYQNTANALATISAGMSNPDMQFSQEIRGLLNGEDKPTNMLFRQLKAIDPLLKDHLADWKKIAAETGNAGYVLEKLGPLLVGYAAASGDIDSLWTTVKSTMSTIRDEVLRGGLKEGFEEIVVQMKEIAKQANDNKEKIQAMLKDGFGWAKVAAEYLWNVGKAAAYLAEPAIWLGISAGIIKVATSMTTLTSEITLATAGLNILVAGLIAAAAYTGKEYFKAEEMESRLNNIKSMSVDGTKGSLAAGLQRERVDRLTTTDLEKILKSNPLASDAEIAEWVKAGAIKKSSLGDKGDAATILGSVGLSVDQRAIEAMKDDAIAAKAPKIPKAPKGGGDVTDLKNNATSADNAYLAYSKAFDERVATQTEIANNNLIEINRQSYEWGLIDLKTYLNEKARLTESSLQADVEAKRSELKDAETHQKEAYSKEITNKKGVRNFDAEALAQTKADTKVEQAQKALIEVEGKLADTKIKNADSGKLATITSIRGYQEERIAFLEMQNDFTGATAIRKKLMEEDVRRLQMVADTYSENDEIRLVAIAALAAAKALDANDTDVAIYKQTEGYKQLQIQILEMTGQYEKAAIARRAFEQSSPTYNNLTPEEQAERDKLSAFDVSQGQAKDKQRIWDNASKMQSAFGGANYGSQIAGIDSEYDAESQKLRDTYATQLIDKKKFDEEMLQLDKQYAAQKAALGLSIVENSLNIAKQGFADSKAMQVVILAMETSIAIARIMMNSAVAKSAAIASAQMAGPLSPAMEAAAISRISAYEAMSIGLVMAGGAIQGMQIAGGRANGGSVIAGQTYVVNENRASQGPEYFTPGVNGVITPASKLGGSTYAPVYNIDARNSTLNEQQITSIVKRANETTKAEILNSMNRGGEFALASGRVR